MDHTRKKVVLFNGPPGVGKDTAVSIAKSFLTGAYGAGQLIGYRPVSMKFADPLKQAAHALLGIPYSCDYYEKEFGNAWKNGPQPEFFGQSPRAVYISLSESFAKETFGIQVFGQVAARRVALEKSANVFLFSDSGFTDEALPIIKLVGVENVYVVELSRPGHDFSGDSRGYIGEKLREQFAGKLSVLRIPNVGDKADFRLFVHGTMSKIFKVLM